MNGATKFLGGLVVAALVAGGSVGCSSSKGPSSGGVATIGSASASFDAQALCAARDAVQAGVGPITISLQSVLANLAPLAFIPVQAPPTVSTTGTDLGGTVKIEFGEGAVINGATLRGSITAVYRKTGSQSGSATIDFRGLSATVSTQAGPETLDIEGVLQATAELQFDRPFAIGKVKGALSIKSSLSGDARIDLDLDYQASGFTGQITLDGMARIESGCGSYTVNFVSIATTVVGGQRRELSQGTLNFTNTRSKTQVSYLFTAPLAGTVTNLLTGETRPFKL